MRNKDVSSFTGHIQGCSGALPDGAPPASHIPSHYSLLHFCCFILNGGVYPTAFQPGKTHKWKGGGGKTRGSCQESEPLMTERKICFMFVSTAHLSDVNFLEVRHGNRAGCKMWLQLCTTTTSRAKLSFNYAIQTHRLLLF